MGKAGAHAAVEALNFTTHLFAEIFEPTNDSRSSSHDISLFWETAGTSVGPAGR